MGKSTAMLQLLAATATGTQWFGLETKKARSLILSAEDDLNEMRRRLEEIIESIPGEYEEKREAFNNIALIDVTTDLDSTLATYDEKASLLKVTELFKQIFSFVRDHNIELIGIDSCADVFAEEMNRHAVRSFIRKLKALGASVVLLGHPSASGMKDGRGYSGSTHWNNAVRSRLKFERITDSNGKEPDPDLRSLELAKSNHAKAKQKIALRWTEAGFIPDEKAASGMDELSRRLKAEEVFMRLTKQFNDQRRPIKSQLLTVRRARDIRQAP